MAPAGDIDAVARLRDRTPPDIPPFGNDVFM